MTQKYIPVEWTDETPTQPGTLINKARMDQMQSAHHFADGFEEVDAIPTEDPGTAYHKVVYCTADSTFYRWDGAQWTADIDDDTKRLLEEHEADHANPHQVTKAQVGLGNADNTSDQNKPVSTAQAAAIKLVQDYLDAHEANHSNPHQVTKAQVGLGNADNTSDADKPISTATAAALAGKVDKLGSSPAGSYTKVTVNAQGQVTAGSNPTTLAEAGITDAYTKSEINTKLADGSVTKVGTANVGSDTLPIKLVAGVPTPVTNTLIDDSTAQDILANKNYVTNTLRIKDRNQPAYSAPSENRQSILQQIVGNDDVWGYRDEFWKYATGAAQIQHRLRTPAGEAEFKQRVEADGTAYMTGPARTYNASNTGDVVTLGLLDQYTPMLRTTGNQTKAGTLTMLSTIQGMASYGQGESSSAFPVGTYCNLIRIARANLSTFRGVAVLLCWQRANGSDLDIIMAQFHLTDAGGIVVYNLGSPQVNYYISHDDDYVYIGIKSKSPTLVAGSRQMRMITQQGFNQYVEFQPYNTGELSAPPGTLVQETNL